MFFWMFFDHCIDDHSSSLMDIDFVRTDVIFRTHVLRRKNKNINKKRGLWMIKYVLLKFEFYFFLFGFVGFVLVCLGDFFGLGAKR